MCTLPLLGVIMEFELNKERSLNLHNSFIFSELINQLPFVSDMIYPNWHKGSVRAYMVDQDVFKLRLYGQMYFIYSSWKGYSTVDFKINNNTIVYSYLDRISNIRKLNWIVIVAYPNFLKMSDEESLNNPDLLEKVGLLFYKVDDTTIINEMINKTKEKAHNSVCRFLLGG